MVEARTKDDRGMDEEELATAVVSSADYGGTKVIPAATSQGFERGGQRKEKDAGWAAYKGWEWEDTD